MDIQPRYLLPRFIRPRVPASCFIRTVNRTSLADIREYKRIRLYVSLNSPRGWQEGGEGRRSWTGEKAEFRIVWGYYFMQVRVLLPRSLR